MHAVIEHFREYYRWYILGVVCILPVLVVFRKYTVPAILFAVELCIYMALLHGAIHLVCLLAAWFKDQSSMKHAFDAIGRDYNPGWTTPIVEFWDRKQYDPWWLLYFEIVLAVAVFVLMWKFRPLQMRRPRKKAPPAKKKPVAAFNYKKTK